MALSTNWRVLSGISGSIDRYASQKDGDDLNAGTAQATPKENITDFLSISVGLRIVIRSSYYNQGDFVHQQKTKEIIADGNTVLDGGGGLINGFISSSGNLDIRTILRNIYILDYSNFSNGSRAILEKCTIKNCNFSKADSDSTDLTIDYLSIIKSVFINSSVSVRGIDTSFLFTGYSRVYNRCIFINSSFIIHKLYFCGVVNITNSFFDKDSNISEGTNPTKTWANLNLTNCAFNLEGLNGTTILSDAIFDITLDGDATTITAEYPENELFSGTVTLDGIVVTFTNCMWVTDPLFVDQANELFYLQATSPLFNNRNIIGKYGQGQLIDATHPQFNPLNVGVVLTDINVVGGNFELDTTGGNQVGSIVGSTDVTHAIDLGGLTTINEEVLFSMAGFNFFNGEWVDRLNYLSGSNDEVRLTYQIQLYDEVLNDWGGTYEFEINHNMTVDGSARGNGNVDIDFANEAPIQVRRFRFANITLRSNGV